MSDQALEPKIKIVDYIPEPVFEHNPVSSSSFLLQKSIISLDNVTIDISNTPPIKPLYRHMYYRMRNLLQNK